MSVELLCPVGGTQQLDAAIEGGADAVYFGAKEFNARMNAKNFDRDELARAVEKAHRAGVRAFVTLNTLLTDRNLTAAGELVSYLYTVGTDALIVADLGLAERIHRLFPDLELHASTQMSGHNTAAAELLSRHGFSRMVAARELDREHLALLCRQSPLPIEVFVHGAICASHSGQCLMSSLIGNRSGNRGECAQPCRMAYNGEYPLSFKDLSLARHVPELIDMGVASFKIEGRMKSPDYVYHTARIWRRLIDERRAATENEWRALADVFSRSGFTDGYFTKRCGPSMLGIRSDADKTKSRHFQKDKTPIRKLVPIPEQTRVAPALLSEPLPDKALVPKTRTARFSRPEQIPDTDYFSVRYLPLDVFDGKRANGVILPSVITDSETDSIRNALEKAKKNGADHLLVGNLGHLSLCEGLGFRLHGDFRFNIMNSFSLRFLDSLSDFEDFLVSPELNLAQLRDLRGKKSVIVYGRMPLMLLEKKVGKDRLRDRTGATFPILSEGKRDILVNSVPFYMADKEKKLKDNGIFSRHFLFTVETAREVEAVIEAYRSKKESASPVKRIP